MYLSQYKKRLLTVKTMEMNEIAPTKVQQTIKQQCTKTITGSPQFIHELFFSVQVTMEKSDL